MHCYHQSACHDLLPLGGVAKPGCTAITSSPASCIRRQACVYRHWSASNDIVPQTHNLYGLEAYLHETLLQSEHRYGATQLGMSEIRFNESRLWMTGAVG